MNKIIIKGRITADPELKTTNNGIPVCTFSVAVNRRFDKETADFINCEAWRKTGEFVNNYFKKGQEILLTGELHIDRYQKDGENRTSTKISVDEVEFCGSKASNQNQKDTDTNTGDFTEFTPVENLSDDLPF